MEFLFFMLLFMFGGWASDRAKDAVDIRKFTENPYCETSEVAGKKFTRCLKAVEVPVHEEKK